MPRPMMWSLRMILSAVLSVAVLSGGARAQVFLPDDPIWVDPDRMDVRSPEEHSINDYYDFWLNTFRAPGEYDGPALNVNTLGEVPNSSWYTNRHYRHPMSIDDLTAGPNTTGGPSEAGPWKVVSGKSEGKTLGLQIEDQRGDRYLLKFDPAGHIELTSGAEVVSTKLLYALGYNVPENYVATFDRSQLVPGEEASLEMAGEEVPVTQPLIDDLLEKAAQYDDGSYRALASKLLKGEPLGPFLYYGTRPDDANDIFPHEGRRELRGLRTIAAWINHTDARGINSLDTFIEEDGRHFVRHHLIDFGSTFGAGPLGPKPRWDGHEYIIDGWAIAARTLSLGIAGLGWAAIDYPDLAALGYIDAEHFDPEEWRPQYPNAAFLRADADDAFWAAKQIMNFSEEELRTIVSTAEYSSPIVADRMLEILLGRQEAIGREYLDYAGGLDRFEVEDGMLTFEDLPANYGFVDAGRSRAVEWRTFDNVSGAVGETIATGTVTDSRLEIPESDAAFLAVDIRTEGAGRTRVYLRSTEGRHQVVGIDRQEQ